MVWVAGAAVIGGIASAEIQSSGAKSAARAQEHAAHNQIELDQYKFDKEMQMEKPWLTAGNTALQTLTKGFGKGGEFTKTFTPGDFTKSPEYAGYKFEQQQGQKSIDQQAAATGRSYSPSTVQALEKYNQGLASTSYQGWYDDSYNQWLNSQKQKIGGLEAIAGFGQAATSESVTASQQSTNNQLTSLQNIGNAKASADIGTSNAWAGAVGGASQNFLNSMYFQGLFSGGL